MVQKDRSMNVDKYLQTHVEGIFLGGDVTGEIRLVATACAEGISTIVMHLKT
jgi:pyruvate/2-oxoglutarate dehydrogenase complex dihydrolipoamide dehydrogenase (E3) component